MNFTMVCTIIFFQYIFSYVWCTNEVMGLKGGKIRNIMGHWCLTCLKGESLTCNLTHIFTLSGQGLDLDVQVGPRAVRAKGLISHL